MHRFKYILSVGFFLISFNLMARPSDLKNQKPQLVIDQIKSVWRLRNINIILEINPDERSCHTFRENPKEPHHTQRVYCNSVFSDLCASEKRGDKNLCIFVLAHEVGHSQQSLELFNSPEDRYPELQDHSGPKELDADEFAIKTLQKMGRNNEEIIAAVDRLVKAEPRARVIRKASVLRFLALKDENKTYQIQDEGSSTP